MARSRRGSSTPPLSGPSPPAGRRKTSSPPSLLERLPGRRLRRWPRCAPVSCWRTASPCVRRWPPSGIPVMLLKEGCATRSRRTPRSPHGRWGPLTCWYLNPQLLPRSRRSRHRVPRRQTPRETSLSVTHRHVPRTDQQRWRRRGRFHRHITSTAGAASITPMLATGIGSLRWAVADAEPHGHGRSPLRPCTSRMTALPCTAVFALRQLARPRRHDPDGRTRCRLGRGHAEAHDGCVESTTTCCWRSPALQEVIGTPIPEDVLQRLVAPGCTRAIRPPLHRSLGLGNPGAAGARRSSPPATAAGRPGKTPAGRGPSAGGRRYSAIPPRPSRTCG